MAAVGWLSGRCRLFLSTGRGLGPCGWASSCRFYSGSAALPEVEGADVRSIEEEVVIPRKKTWNNVAVLQALESTVNRDPTAVPYAFQDDPYLIPTSTSESRSFLLAKKSGENAAKFIINSHPKYFQKDIAEPHIPCLMPEYFEPQIEGISEAALKERIKLKKVKASVDMFDQLLQAGTTVSLETTNSLLDLLCYYGDQEPPADYHFQQTEKSEELEETTEENEKSRRKNGHPFGVAWREKNNAERIFALMPEKDAHSYCTMIRGMVKHRANEQALKLYTELLNNRLHADVYTFNALIEATALTVNEKFDAKWNHMQELMKQMVAQKVKPNLLTFNTTLKCLRRFHAFGRTPALQTLREMKAVGIEPSLATYHYLIQLFYQSESSSKVSSLIIYDIMNELMGKTFSSKDLDDDMFFQSAMRVCSALRDLELAYQVHGLLNTGDNRKFIGPDHRRNFYYSKFFSLLCLMEQIDITLKWYKDLIPSVFFPHSQTLIDLLQALDVANRLEMIPQIWKDSKEYGHTFRSDLREEILTLMARDKHPPELQVAFADCALDIRSTYESQDARQPASSWPAIPLNCIAVLLLRAGRTQEAWTMLGLFRKHNRIPRNELLNEFMDSAKVSNNPAQAIEVVKLANAFSLPAREGLTQTLMADFLITQEQKEALGKLTAVTSDTDSSSDSDSSEDE
ncbi:PREDICTED: pentatricopeptide repeat domain-containing protein 3, mitochondrial [Chrysochloris asiatica]|uniref:Small ribosomal subunit protein mS39 n=1 Tax=Chrysochloris asiatica TaxID=185453 RepID=A0A9B0UAZ3_CHRAS|nr:PREDICTED: pentatricopeptide repeat domain-containing protein 3, mitochondrial [Chrysochloris asiatica]